MGEVQDWTTGHPQIVYARCRACDRRLYLPRTSCPDCGGSDFELRAAKGDGRAIAVTELSMSQGGGAPMALALVDLDEGVRVLTRCDPSCIPGERVIVTFAGSPSAPRKQSHLVPFAMLAGSRP